MNGRKRRRGPMKASDLMSQLESDPEWVARRDARDLEIKREEERLRVAEEPLTQELKDAGFRVDSAWDLVNTSTPYPAALPILLKHLQQDYPDRVREGIARALAVRGGDAKFAWRTLVRLYRDEEPGTNAKDGLAVAIAAVADAEVIGEVIALASETRHGASRVLLLRALTRSRQPEARTAIDDLATDPQLAKEIGVIQRRRRRGRKRADR